MEIEAQLVQRKIMEDAANLANQMILNDPALTQYVPKPGFNKTGRFRPENRTPEKRRNYIIAGQLFRYDPNRSNRGGMTLSMDDSVNSLPGEVLDTLRRVANVAMRQALVMNSKEIGYLVLLHAWNGINYFDTFADANEQIRLL